MKVFVFLMTCFVFMANATIVKSQSAKLTVSFQNARLIDVFEKIEEQSKIGFLLPSELLKDNRNITLSLKNVTIETILENILDNAVYKYKFVGRNIVITKRAVVQQKRLVKGKVTNTSGEPIPGVTIVVKGTTQGTITDANGNYTLTNVPSNANLVFSFIGMKRQEVAVAGKTSINVTLEEETIGIEEVVAIGYGTMKKSDLTGSVASIKSEAIQEVKIISADQALSGRIAGVQVTQQSSAPGGGVSIRIRGGNSVIGDNEPLYVIDGFPVTTNNATRSAGTSGYVSPNSLSSINPNDIESIEVLKDASATAIYGARGANGVILITTKKGHSGASRLTFDSYYGVQSIAKKLELTTAEQYAIFANEVAEQKGFSPVFSNPSSLGKGIDWQDQVYTTAPVQNYQLGISGGQGKSIYYVSGNYFSQDGVIKNSRYQRYSVRMNLETEIGDRIKVGTTFAGSRSINNQMRTEEGNGGAEGVVRAALFFHPYLDIYNEDGTYTIIPEDAEEGLNTTTQMDNPLALLNETKNDITGNRLLTNVYGQLNLAKGLYLKVSLGADVEDQLYESYYSRKVRAGLNRDGVARTNNLHYVSYLNENTLSYSTDITGVHQLNVLVGYTRQKEEVKRQNMYNSNFLDDVLGSDGIGNGNRDGGPSVGASHTQWQLASWLGRINYKFKDKYLLTLSARADGSSRLGKNQRWGFFPSGALAWNVYKEGFMENIKAVENLKLRVSYGLTGNTGIGSYQSISSLSTTYYSFNDIRVVGYFPGKLPNADLRWESTAQFNAGLDVGFLNGRLRLTADYYVKNTSDLLLNVTLPYSSGFGSALKNTGMVRNKGVELALGATVLKSPLTWETNLNWSMNRNKLMDLGNSAPFLEDKIVGITYVDEGHALGEFWGYKTDGIFKTQAEADAYTPQPTAKAGDVKYVDVNQNGKFDNSDRTYFGNPYPDFIFGWNNTFRYKAFSLTAFIMGTVGNDIFNVTDARRSLVLDLNHSLQSFNNRWTPEHTDATQPRAGWSAGLWAIDLFKEDGSFVRLKTLQLGYDIPLKNTGQVKNAFVYISGQNLFTLTNYTGYNPEVNSVGNNNLIQGVDMGAYPIAKTYLLGIKVEF